MNRNVSIEYANAYSEVLEVLNHMPKYDYDKIPKDMIDMFQNNCNNEHQFRYDLKKEFEEQEISKRAKLILAILFRDYWATPYQKQKIIEKQNWSRMQIEKEKIERYNPDNIFKKNSEKEKVSNNLLVEVKKENFYHKVVNFIKRILNKFV
ncbi:MAG: hypothetical protein ACI4UE_05925 [Candidatus Scatovivens sp.]